MTVSNRCPNQVIEAVISEHLTGESLVNLTAQIGYDITKTFIKEEFEHFSKKVDEFALSKISEKQKDFDQDAAIAKINEHLRLVCKVKESPVHNGYPPLLKLLSGVISYFSPR